MRLTKIGIAVKSECALLQVGHVNAGEKLANVELALANIALPAAVVGIDVNRQIDVSRFHSAIDQRPAANRTPRRS